MERDMTMVDLVSLAITNEYQNWKMMVLKGDLHNNTIWNNKLALDVIKELDSIVKYVSAYEFFRETCEEFTITPERFSSENLTQNFIKSMCNKLLKICKPEDVEQFWKRILIVKKSYKKDKKEKIPC